MNYYKHIRSNVYFLPIFFIWMFDLLCMENIEKNIKNGTPLTHEQFMIFLENANPNIPWMQRCDFLVEKPFNERAKQLVKNLGFTNCLIATTLIIQCAAFDLKNIIDYYVYGYPDEHFVIILSKIMPYSFFLSGGLAKVFYDEYNTIAPYRRIQMNGLAMTEMPC